MMTQADEEEEEKYKHLNRVKSSGVFNSGTAAASAGAIYGVGSGSSVYMSKSTAGELKNYDQVYNSNLSTADKLLSYRVIECGVVFDSESKELCLNS